MSWQVDSYRPFYTTPSSTGISQLRLCSHAHHSSHCCQVYYFRSGISFVFLLFSRVVRWKEFSRFDYFDLIEYFSVRIGLKVVTTKNGWCNCILPHSICELDCLTYVLLSTMYQLFTACSRFAFSKNRLQQSIQRWREGCSTRMAWIDTMTHSHDINTWARYLCIGAIPMHFWIDLILIHC